MNVSHVWLRKDGVGKDAVLRVLVRDADGTYRIAIEDRAGDLTQEEMSHDTYLDGARVLPIDPIAFTE